MLNLVKKFSCHIFLVLVPFFSFADNLQVPSIEFSNLNAALSSGDTIIIDARPAVFYELGHIPNAASLPLVNFEASFDRVNKEYNLKKFKQIIVYCSDRDCDDSDKLAKKLQAKGLDNIVVYKGGWQEWEKMQNSVHYAGSYQELCGFFREKPHQRKVCRKKSRAFIDG